MSLSVLGCLVLWSNNVRRSHSPSGVICYYSLSRFVISHYLVCGGQRCNVCGISCALCDTMWHRVTREMNLVLFGYALYYKVLMWVYKCHRITRCWDTLGLVYVMDSIIQWLACNKELFLAPYKSMVFSYSCSCPLFDAPLKWPGLMIGDSQLSQGNCMRLLVTQHL